ncbi:MAG: isocitrate/isopropylmalate dehydrogenase family protein, partial [Clostridia bacterium]|nr:isocitrate/isopropylmalate dehydrogenase family protein [Clostridia bacterium]
MNEVQINAALEKFKALLIEQDERNQKIKATKEFNDFKNLDKIVIGVCGGDGIGPIITKESANVLKF